MVGTSCWWSSLLLVLTVVGREAAWAQVLFKGTCPNIPPMKDFDPEAFLGRWYEIERFFVSYEAAAGTCWVEVYLHDPDRGYYTRLEWKERLTEKILSIENGLTLSEEPGRLRYVLQRPNIPFLQGEYLILATDYSSYALAWQCQDLPLIFGHTEILWFLSKEQHPNSATVQSAKHIAAGLGLQVSFLLEQDRTSCPP
ncbi:apolipoprotein D-like [Panulirus ornatus]|uniref:apolipoprotein D-like n=1 Tax=Panulirus ornatus TaxID=150431 RepID=UPI003A88961D